MNRSVAAIGSGLLAAAAAAAIVLFAREPQQQLQPARSAGPVDYFDPGAATEDRIRALEAAVAEERNARLLLEEELQALYEQLDELADAGQQAVQDPVADSRDFPERFGDMRAQRTVDESERRTNQLVDAGFSPERAEWLVRRESELQMEQMRTYFEARQAGERVDRDDIRLNPDRALRAEIGDAEYERYREAYGRSTSVAVGTVLESSPGQLAGLRSGDEIVAYGGKRVFSYGELNRITMEAQAGQSVVVDIVRDGVPMQVVVEAGPIGISNRGFPGRR